MRRVLLAAVMLGAAAGAQAADMPDLTDSSRGFHRRADCGTGQLAGLLHRRARKLRINHVKAGGLASTAVCHRRSSRQPGNRQDS